MPPHTHSAARTIVDPAPDSFPADRPEQALVVAFLERPTGTASSRTEARAGSACTTSYDDGSSVSVQWAGTDSQALAVLAAALLPEGMTLSGYLRIDGRLVLAQERRTEQWAVRAAAWRGLAVVTRTPARTPGLPHVRLTVLTHEPVTQPAGEAS
ncbi:hypothetical protein ACFU7Y_06385 [Kitasatospora sp. NPDC057542]|uniref:hypothetical protein n=1 Tax=Kitasatospora sp. NPDC057542 TaxID=3346162 RepID=UPI003689B23E